MNIMNISKATAVKISLFTLSMLIPTVSVIAADKSNDEAIDLVSWNSAKSYYSGWRAGDMLDATVYGVDNEEIGEIENIVVDSEGNAKKVIIESGGFLDIGDTHLSVPWNKVEIAMDMESVKVPVDKDDIDQFSLFNGDEDVKVDENAWRITQLIGDYVKFKDNTGYGIVDDLIFNNQGEVLAVVVNPDISLNTPGYYAYPYRAYDSRLGTYQIPYNLSEINELKPFDYSDLNNGQTQTTN